VSVSLESVGGGGKQPERRGGGNRGGLVGGGRRRHDLPLPRRHAKGAEHSVWVGRSPRVGCRTQSPPTVPVGRLFLR
ncbi:unnamed protein product, partial [Laminaria digitata]